MSMKRTIPSLDRAGSKDPVFQAFLERQAAEGAELAAASDLLELEALGRSPAQLYVARFRCKGLVKKPGGEIEEADRFEVGVRFPSDYLRRAEPSEVLTWLGPPNVWHPNIAHGAPFICVGRLVPGTPLVDLLYQCFEIVTYTKVTMREDDALNPAACAWARENQHRFPLDRRPLKRRAIELRAAASGRSRSRIRGGTTRGGGT